MNAGTIANHLAFAAVCFGTHAKVHNDSGDVFPVGKVLAYHGADSSLVRLLEFHQGRIDSRSESERQLELFDSLLPVFVAQSAFLRLFHSAKSLKS